MKKIVIGITFLIAGIIQTGSVIYFAIIAMPEMSSWSTRYPSRLWSLIFGGNDSSGLALGLFFALGIVMLIFGLIVLLKEYFMKND